MSSPNASRTDNRNWPALVEGEFVEGAEETSCGLMHG